MAAINMITLLRLPQSLVDRSEALIDALAQDEEALLLGRVSRSIVLRLAILRGLEVLESPRVTYFESLDRKLIYQLPLI